jgi:hypothetical protein
LDTLIVISKTANPDNHNLDLMAIIESYDQDVVDSVPLFDDGNHNDSAASDGVFGGFWPVIAGERNYNVHVKTLSMNSGYYSIFKNAVSFTTIGPLVFDGIRNISEDQEVNPGDKLIFRFTLKNNGSMGTAVNVMSHAIPLDTCASISKFNIYKYENIAAGTSVEGAKSGQTINFNKNCGDCTARFAMEILSNNYPFWTDTFTIDIHTPTGIHSYESDINEFVLNQNYPNPFNLNTTISYQLPHQSHVLLKVYDIQGREVTTLVNGFEQQGNKSVILNAEGWPGGIYYYRLQAGDFIQTRKLILLR